MKTWPICLLIVFPLLLHSQIEPVEWGPEHLLDGDFRGKSRTLFIDADDDHFYLLAGMHKGRETVFTYSYDNTIVKQEDVHLSYEGNSLRITDVVKLSNTFGLSYNINKPDKKLELILTDFEQGSFSNPRKVYEHSYKKQGVILEPQNWLDIPQTDMIARFFYSPDRSKVVFVNQTFDDGNERNDEEFQVAVFNKQMDLLWEKTIYIPIKDQKFVAESFVVSNSGEDVFFVAHHHHYALIYHADYKIYQVTEQKISDYDVPLQEDYRLRTLGLFIEEENDRVVLGGLYHERGNAATGVYSGTFDVVRKRYSDIRYKLLEEADEVRFDKFFAPTQLTRMPSGYYLLIATTLDKQYDSWTNADEPNVITAAYTDDMAVVTFHPDKGVVQSMAINRPHPISFHKNLWAYGQEGDRSFLVVDVMITRSFREQFRIKGGAFHQFLLYLEFDEKGAIRDQKALTSSKDTKQIAKEYYAFQKDGKIYVGGTFEKISQGPGVARRYMKFFSLE
jgi:hypothetical protein